MKTTAFFSTAFGVFLLAFACLEYGIGDLECAASTSVLSGFFIVSGLTLFVVSRRRRARSAGLAEPDLARLGRPLFQKAPSADILKSSYRIPKSEPSHVEQAKASDEYTDRIADFGALGKRADVKKLIVELRNQTPKRKK